MNFGDLIGIGANFDEMPANSFNIAHFSRYRVIPVASQPVDDGTHDEVRAKLLGQAVEFVDITFTIAYMNASVWLTEKPTDWRRFSSQRMLSLVSIGTRVGLILRLS